MTISKPRISVVTSSTSLTEKSLADAARDLLEKALASNPATILIAWEPEATDYVVETVPPSPALRHGWIDRMYSRYVEDGE